MADMFTKEKRSEIMSSIRSKNTRPERVLFEHAKTLWKEGFRYVKHSNRITGKPDLAFPRQRVAVFVDSEFWHGRDFGSWGGRLPKAYWRKKITRNIKRDRKVTAELRKSGWGVVRIWSKNLLKKPASEVGRIRKILAA